jgi:hypothetical protein
MSGLTGFNVGYSNTFGGELSFLDISYILAPKTSGTNINTNFFYNKNPGSLSITYTDLSNVFLKSKTNNVIDISYQVIPVTKYYDQSLNTTPVTYYDIGQVFEPYYNDISFSSITSKQTGLIIYKYINGVKIVNNGYSNFTGNFVINPGQTGFKSVKFACVGGGGGSLYGGGGGGAGVIIGSVDMSYNHSYYFGVGNGNPGTGGTTHFRSTSATSNTIYNFISAGGGVGSTVGSGTVDVSGNGGLGGDATVKLSTGFNCTINYISSGGGGGGGYNSFSPGNYGTGGKAGSLTVSGTGTPTFDISGIGQKGLDASNNPVSYGGNGGGNFSSTYTSFNSIPDQTTYYFGGGGGGSNFSNNGYPSTYPTNGWNSGGNGATTTINSSVIDSYQFGGGGGGSKTYTAVGGGGPGALMFSWNYP